MTNGKGRQGTARARCTVCATIICIGLALLGVTPAAAAQPIVLLFPFGVMLIVLAVLTWGGGHCMGDNDDGEEGSQ